MFMAVETSDLVHSTKMSPSIYSGVIDALKYQLTNAQATCGARFDIFRGDAFQVVYTAPKFAVRAGLLTRLKLLHCIEGSPIGVTQAIAFGHQIKIDDELSQSMGEVFIASGRLLDRTKRRHLSIEFPAYGSAIALIQAYLNHYLMSLTQKQAEVLYHYLDKNFPEQHVIADKLHITRQNVAAHLKRGGADLLKHTVEFFENSCEDAKQ